MSTKDGSASKSPRAAAVCALALAVASMFCQPAIAQQGSVQGSLPATDLLRVQDLERTFWACDYVATNRGVSATPLAVCGAAYEELKSIKFHGDFIELLLWWKENKAVEHQNIAGKDDTTVQPLNRR